MTVENLCNALNEYLSTGGSPKALVEIEGCDCVGKAEGLMKYGESLLITRLSGYSGGEVLSVNKNNLITGISND